MVRDQIVTNYPRRAAPRGGKLAESVERLRFYGLRFGVWRHPEAPSEGPEQVSVVGARAGR